MVCFRDDEVEVLDLIVKTFQQEKTGLMLNLRKVARRIARKRRRTPLRQGDAAKV
jgi:hypothetical protein